MSSNDVVTRKIDNLSHNIGVRKLYSPDFLPIKPTNVKYILLSNPMFRKILYSMFILLTPGRRPAAGEEASAGPAGEAPHLRAAHQLPDGAQGPRTTPCGAHAASYGAHDEPLRQCRAQRMARQW